MKHRILGHIVRHAGYGAIFGAGLLLLGLVRYAVAGGRTLPSIGAFLGDVSLYVGGFAIAGAIVGALHPLRYSRFGAACVGAVAALPIVAGVALMVDRTDWHSLTWPFGLALAAVVGWFWGLSHLQVDRPLTAAESLPATRLRTVLPRRMPNEEL